MSYLPFTNKKYVLKVQCTYNGVTGSYLAYAENDKPATTIHKDLISLFQSKEYKTLKNQY